ncbi:MAG: hypothetical protein DIU68_010480 [Chloroflexota bacterium]|nr:MAG: hypothetical protein DIU68_01930 [Chloroflexota bacterium]
MSRTGETPFILYVSDRPDQSVLPVLNKHDGVLWHVYSAAELYDALASYIFFNPHLTILVGESSLTQGVFFHLASLSEPSPRRVDAMLVYANRAPGKMPPATLLRHYPLPADEDDVVSSILRLAQERAAAEAAAWGIATPDVLR